MKIELPNEEASGAFGARLAAFLVKQALPLIVVYLHGELGAGKTTLVRSVLRGLGHQGSVKSPTYTLVEEYDAAGYKVFHFDLYRLADAEELEFMGMRDFLNPALVDAKGILCFVEWSERGGALLPSADLELYLMVQGEGRVCELELNSAQQLDSKALENEVVDVA